MNRKTRERLLELFAQFPPVAIQTEDDLAAAQQVVDGLLGRERTMPRSCISISSAPSAAA